MYPYHNLILKRIKNGELLWIEKVDGKFSYIFHFKTYPYSRPIRSHAEYRYKNIIDIYTKKTDK